MPNDTWQHTVADPAFTWPAATDVGCGVAAYRVYWGPDPKGVVVTMETTARAFDPPILLSPSVYYLRLQTRDGAGNLAPWSTLLKFRYDATPPVPPITLVSGNPAVGTCSADRTVAVIWSPASDSAGGSGVTGYSVAWSTAATTLPDPIVDLDQRATTSSELATGAWYVHIRPRILPAIGPPPLPTSALPG